jgi:hypothetical protein
MRYKIVIYQYINVLLKYKCPKIVSILPQILNGKSIYIYAEALLY